MNDGHPFESPEARAVLETSHAIAVALVRDRVRYNAGLELAHRDAIERWGRLIVHGERIVKVDDESAAYQAALDRIQEIEAQL